MNIRAWSPAVSTVSTSNSALPCIYRMPDWIATVSHNLTNWEELSADNYTLLIGFD